MGTDFASLLIAYVVAIVVYLIVFGLIGAAVMGGKGRNEFLGFAMGICGPIGVIMALLVRPSDENEARRQMRVEALKRSIMSQGNLENEIASTEEGGFSGLPNTVSIEQMRSHFRWICRECGERGLWVDRNSVEGDAQSHSCASGRPLAR